MRLILSTLAFIVFSFAATAQTDTSYQLLWYKGKQIKINVLLTPQADTVRLDPVKKTVRVTVKKTSDGPYAAKLAELSKTSQRIQEGIKLFATLPTKAKPAYVLYLESAYNDIQNELTSIQKTPITLAESGSASLSGSMGTGKGGYWEPELQEEPDWDQKINEMWEEARRLNNGPLFTKMPTPPNVNLGYGEGCTREGVAWHQKKSEFVRLLKSEENALYIKAILLSQQASEHLNGFFSRDKYNKVQTEVYNTLYFINQRLQKKISLLVNTYGDDPKLAISLMHVIYELENEQYQLLPTIPFNQSYSYKLCGTMIKAIETAIKERDYVVALDVDFFLSAQRYCKVMNFEIPDHYGLWQRFFKFNQFRLDMNVAAKAQADGGYIESELKGSGWFMAVPNKEKCRLDWLLIGPEQVFLNMDVIKNNVIMKAPVPYVGGKIFHTGTPHIKVDFYSERVEGDDEWTILPEELFWADSIIINPFTEKFNNELWKFPAPAGVQKAALTNTVILGCFFDVERAKQARAESPELKKRAEKMKEELLNEYMPMIEKYKSTQGTRAPVTAAEFKKLHDLQQKTSKMTEITDELPGNYIFFPYVVATKDPVIVDDVLHGKVLFPENAATVYAWFKLKLEHDPGAPYNKFYISK